MKIAFYFLLLRNRQHLELIALSKCPFQLIRWEAGFFDLVSKYDMGIGTFNKNLPKTIPIFVKNPS